MQSNHTNRRKARILIVSGESSGDQHAATLINACRDELTFSIDFFAMGGQAVRKTGAHCLVDIEEVSVVGLTEIIKRWPAIRRAMKTLKRWLADNRPDLVILVDYPGFNLILARYAKRLNLKVLYYISPQIWAWRPHRIARIKACVDHMVVLFPFEVPYYKAARIPVSLVPHPLLKQVRVSAMPYQLKKKWRVINGKPIITLMPGSREAELRRLAPLFYQTVCRLKAHYPALHVLLPLVDPKHRQWLDRIQPAIGQCPWVTLLEQQAYDALSVSDVALIASGTATLEAALLGVPMVVAYRTSWLTYRLAKWLVKLPYISLCNIVAGRKIVPEYVQHQATSEALAQALAYLLRPRTNHAMREALVLVKRELSVEV